MVGFDVLHCEARYYVINPVESMLVLLMVWQIVACLPAGLNEHSGHLVVKLCSCSID